MGIEVACDRLVAALGMTLKLVGDDGLDGQQPMLSARIGLFVWGIRSRRVEDVIWRIEKIALVRAK